MSTQITRIDNYTCISLLMHFAVLVMMFQLRLVVLCLLQGCLSYSQGFVQHDQFGERLGKLNLQFTTTKPRNSAYIVANTVAYRGLY